MVVIFIHWYSDRGFDFASAKFNLDWKFRGSCAYTKGMVGQYCGNLAQQFPALVYIIVMQILNFNPILKVYGAFLNIEY